MKTTEGAAFSTASAKKLYCWERRELMLLVVHLAFGKLLVNFRELLAAISFEFVAVGGSFLW